jgi:hypothetical protein
MITTWRAVAADGVKPGSWRMLVAAHLCAPSREPAPQLLYAILDTGSPWSVVAGNLARQFCGTEWFEKRPFQA